MRIYVILFVSSMLLLSGCANNKVNHHQSILKDYETIEKSAGKSVIFTGYVSLTHGATGVYFSKRDLIKENGKCILPVPFTYSSHDEKVIVSGTIKKTDCGLGSICTNVCADFEIVSENR